MKDWMAVRPTHVQSVNSRKYSPIHPCQLFCRRFLEIINRITSLVPAREKREEDSLFIGHQNQREW